VLFLFDRILSALQPFSAPSPARHGCCEKDRNSRAACPLPGQGEGEK
jgi:hypothetical protein